MWIRDSEPLILVEPGNAINFSLSIWVSHHVFDYRTLELVDCFLMNKLGDELFSVSQGKRPELLKVVYRNSFNASHRILVNMEAKLVCLKNQPSIYYRPEFA